MRKLIVAAVAAASLSGGAVAVAALAPIGVASAQDAPTTSDAPPTTKAPATPKVKPRVRAAVRARLGRRPGTHRGEIASYLGLTPEALRQELRSGKSLAEIAGAKTPGLVEMLTNNANERIDAALESGRIDAARAAKLKEHVGAMVERLVNAKKQVG